MTPQIKLQEGKLVVEGDFDFKFEKPVYNLTTYMPTVDITFKWCPEVSMEAQLVMKEGQSIELIAEKLKQDFIKYLKISNTSL